MNVTKFLSRETLSKVVSKLRNNPNLFFAIFLLCYFILMILFSAYRSVGHDEGIYIKEAWLISELFKQGKWIGNYAVGLHGFLFKIPPALVFIFTGPSVAVVTWYNIFLGMITSFLFYKLIKDTLKNPWYALLATILMMTNFHFLLSMPTFLRDIPSLLITVLFLYAIVKKWNLYRMSFVFLLLLDSKEYVFLVYALFYVIWLFINCNENNFLKKIISLLRSYLIVFLPSLVWLVLMFTTSIIPINMFIASIFGLNTDNLNYTIKHFTPKVSSLNYIDGGKSVSLLGGEEPSGIVRVFNFIISFFAKTLYPRTFSFLSIPKEIILPVVLSSIILIKRFFKQKFLGKSIFTSSALLILIWIPFYVARASHGRYLLPILPAISIMTIYFFFFLELKRKRFLLLILALTIFITLGLFFEVSFLLPKIFISLSLIVLFTISFIKKQKNIFKELFIIGTSCFTLGTAVLFSKTQGQINSYILGNGYKQVEEVAESFPTDKVIAVNDFANEDYLSVLVKDRSSSPEDKWELKDFIPKKTLLEEIGGKRLYTYSILYSEKLKDYFIYPLQDYEWEEIEELILVSSSINQDSGSNVNYYKKLIKLDWLVLDRQYKVGDKVIYVFNVKS